MTVRPKPEFGRAHRRPGSVPVILASIGIFVSATGAFASNQLNPFPINAIATCANTAQSPCIEWTKTAANLSTTVYTLVGHTLEDQEVNLKVDAETAVATYNAIAARNPHLQLTTNSSIDELTVAMSAMDYDVYGSTTNEWQPNPPYHIFASVIRMNPAIVWNHTLNFSCNHPAQVCNADGRKVINHEFGHAEGLAHEPLSVNSVMRKGPLSDYRVQLYDRNGIIQIYGAYP